MLNDGLVMASRFIASGSTPDLVYEQQLLMLSYKLLQ
jgi:hypothetical protein